MKYVVLFVLALAILFQDSFRKIVVKIFSNIFENGRREWLETTGVADLIEPGSTVLDFGSGVGSLTRMLRAKGHDVTALDIGTSCYIGDPSEVVIYDGGRIPFPDASFDVGVACTVMHHIPDADASLTELLRVCKRVIIVEDVPTSPAHAVLVCMLDSLCNWEILGHPHSNKTDAEWKRAFEERGATLEREVRLGGVFNHIIYVVKS